MIYYLFVLLFTQFQRRPQLHNNQNANANALNATNLFRRGSSVPINGNNIPQSTAANAGTIINDGNNNGMHIDSQHGDNLRRPQVSQIEELKAQLAVLQQQTLLNNSNSISNALFNSGGNNGKVQAQVYNSDLLSQFSLASAGNNGFNARKFLEDFVIRKHCLSILDKLTNRQVSFGTIKPGEALNVNKFKMDFVGMPGIMLTGLMFENVVDLIQSKPLESFSKCDLVSLLLNNLLSILEYQTRTVHLPASIKLNVVNQYGANTWKRYNNNILETMKKSLRDGSFGAFGLSVFNPKFNNNNNNNNKNKFNKNKQIKFTQFTIPQGICVKFNKSKCDSSAADCKYKHVCGKCFDATHGYSSCPNK